MTTIPDVPGGSSRDGVSSEPRASSTAATTRPTSTAASAARRRRVRRAYGASAPMSADGTAGTGRRKRLRGTTTPILAGDANVPLEAQDRLGRRRCLRPGELESFAREFLCPLRSKLHPKPLERTAARCPVALSACAFEDRQRT